MFTGKHLLSACLTALVALNANAAVQSWTADPLNRVAKGAQKPLGANSNISLVAAKNEYENAQIVLRNNTNFSINSVSFSDLTNPSGSVIGKENLSFNFVEYEQSDAPIAARKFNNATGNEIYPASIAPDPFSNKTSIAVSANQAQPIFVSTYIPKTAATGVFTGTVTVATTEGSFNFPLSVDVHNVSIPDGKDSALDQYIWSEFDSYSLEHNADIGRDYFGGITKYSNDWWQMVENSAEVMVKHRQNRVIVWTINLLKDGGTTVNADGSIAWNWSKFDQFVQTFVDKGITKFGGGHLAYHWNGTPGSFPNGNQIVRLARDANGNTIITGGTLPTSLSNENSHPETKAWLEAFIPALKTHLQSKGWYDNWIQHIYDEPPVANWSYLVDKVRQLDPTIKTMDAAYTAGLHGQASKINSWVPLLTLYEGNRAFYAAQKAAGKKIYIYTTMSPGAPGLNRRLSNHLIANDFMSWYLFKEKADGFLHWALNLWSYGYTDGDTTITYPDSVNKTLLSSLRYEAQRDGLENYELLQIVNASNANLANNFVSQVLDNYTTYTTDLTYYRQIRELLVKAASGQSVTLPTKPNFSSNIGLAQGETLINDDSSNITYTGSWTDDNNRAQFNNHNNDSHYATANDAAFELSFNGTGVDFYTEVNADYGDIDIFIDGVKDTTVSALGANGRQSQVKLYSKSGLSNGQHTLKGVKKSGSYMLVDAFVVKAGGSANTTTYNNDNSAITYSSGWTHDTARAAFGDLNNDAHITQNNDAYAEFTFTGTGIEVIAEKNSDQGNYEIIIDGTSVATVDTSNATRLAQQVVYSKMNLSAGQHTIRVVKKSGSWAVIDAFRVTTGGAGPAPVFINDDATGISYSNSDWTDDNARPFNDHNNDVHWTQTNEASAEYSFSGTGIEYISEKNSDMGEVEIFIDNVSQGRVNGNNSTRLTRQVLFSKTGLSSGNHTIKIVKKTGQYALVDGFNVIQ